VRAVLLFVESYLVVWTLVGVAVYVVSAARKDCVIIITYDENGGRWDHVVPPVRSDGWGVGVRVPTIVISPFAQQGRVDNTEYETVSILKLIERRFNLAPLASRDKDPKINDLTHALSCGGPRQPYSNGQRRQRNRAASNPIKPSRCGQPQ
jgi:phospholipase C